MTLGHEKLDVYGAILLKKNAQSTEKMRSIPMKQNLNQTVEATPNGAPHFYHYLL